MITGGAGFIGSNLIKNAIDKGYKILNFDALTYASNLKNLADVIKHPNYYFVEGNICDSEKVNSIFKEFKPNCIMHLAAETHVDNSIFSPGRFIETNIQGTANLLQCSLNYWRKLEKSDEFKFVHVSTDEVFGSLLDNGSFNENSPYLPNSPYSASKAASDLLVRSWCKTYNFPAIISNCSNNYGFYQFSEKLIPKTIQSILQNKNIEVYGSGKNIRDWIHVSDHCNAILLLSEKGRVGEQYLVGGSNEVNNLELIGNICKIISELIPSKKNPERLISFVSDRPGHDYRYAVDASKIKNELNWEAKIGFQIGLKQTVEWYIKNSNWWQAS